MDAQTQEKLKGIEEAWDHDMKHPFSACLMSGGTSYYAMFNDGHTDIRSIEEARKNPFFVALPKSDVANIGVLLQLVREQETQLSKYERVIKAAWKVTETQPFGARDIYQTDADSMRKLEIELEALK